MAWPPNPNKESHNHNEHTHVSANTGREWRLLEKTLLASIDEQRRARRWGIFFKLLTFVYILFIIITLRSCNSVVPSVGAHSGAQLNTTEPHLAMVNIEGVIAADSNSNAADINSALVDAFDNEDAKAVVLNINSPGGSPVQSDEIWQMIMDLKAEHGDKKVYAVIGDMGASGAYYIAAAADEIWVNPSSLVGSIGVIMSGYNIEGLLGKMGVQDRTMTAGEFKDIGSMSRAMTAEEKAHIENLLATTHHNFIDAVKKGRGDKLKDPEGNKLFSGLFWTGKDAVALGLADKTGGISQLKKSLDMTVVVDYTYQDPMNSLFDRLGVQMGKGLGQGVKLSLMNDEPSLK